MSENNNDKKKNTDKEQILYYIEKIIENNNNEFYEAQLASYINSLDRKNILLDLMMENSFPLKILSVIIKDDVEKINEQGEDNKLTLMTNSLISSTFGTKFDSTNMWQDVIAKRGLSLCVYKTKKNELKFRFINKNNVSEVAKKISEENGYKDNIKISDINHAGCAFILECNSCCERYEDNYLENKDTDFDVLFISNLCAAPYKDSSLEKAAKEKYTQLFPILKIFNKKGQKVDLDFCSSCKSTLFETSFLGELNKSCNIGELKINNLQGKLLEMPFETIGRLNMFDYSVDKKNAKNIANIITNGKIENCMFKFGLPTNQNEILHQNSTVFSTIEKIISYVCDDIRKTDNKQEKIKKLIKMTDSIKLSVRVINANDTSHNTYVYVSVPISKEKYEKLVNDIVSNSKEKDNEYLIPEQFMSYNSIDKKLKDNTAKAYNAALDFLKTQAEEMEKFLSEQKITQEDIYNYLQGKGSKEKDDTDAGKQKSFIASNNQIANTTLSSDKSNTLKK